MYENAKSDVEMVSEMLAGEIEGITKYETLISQTNSPELKAMLAEIIQHEKMHAKRMHAFLGNFL